MHGIAEHRLPPHPKCHISQCYQKKTHFMESSCALDLLQSVMGNFSRNRFKRFCAILPKAQTDKETVAKTLGICSTFSGSYCNTASNKSQ